VLVLHYILMSVLLRRICCMKILRGLHLKTWVPLRMLRKTKMIQSMEMFLNGVEQNDFVKFSSMGDINQSK
jgi:hypothetical protein